MVRYWQDKRLMCTKRLANNIIKQVRTFAKEFRASEDGTSYVLFLGLQSKQTFQINMKEGTVAYKEGVRMLEIETTLEQLLSFDKDWFTSVYRSVILYVDLLFVQDRELDCIITDQFHFVRLNIVVITNNYIKEKEIDIYSSHIVRWDIDTTGLRFNSIDTPNMYGLLEKLSGKNITYNSYRMKITNKFYSDYELEEYCEVFKNAFSTVTKLTFYMDILDAPEDFYNIETRFNDFVLFLYNLGIKLDFYYDVQYFVNMTSIILWETLSVHSFEFADRRYSSPLQYFDTVLCLGIDEGELGDSIQDVVDYLNQHNQLDLAKGLESFANT